MKSRIPSTKASPADIIELIKIVKEFTGNIDIMRKKIHEYLLKKSRRGIRDEYNSVYAICFPTLKRLDLIKGKGATIHLSPDAEALIRTYEDKGTLGYKKLFAKIILRIDLEKAHVSENLRNFKKDHVSLDEIAKYLKSKGIDTNEKDDRLKKWLRFLKFVNFIEEEDNKIRINKFQINSIFCGKKAISFNKFLNAFFTSYEKLQSKSRGSKYIKIPDLEKEVCLKLQDYNFTTFDFRINLTRLRRKMIDNKKILFSKPGAREKDGIKINGIYYYYISIFNIGEEK